MNPPEAPTAQAAVLRSQAAMLAREGLDEASSALAFELADLLGCRRVSVGLMERGTLRIVGSSHAPGMDERRAARAAIVAAMHEALDQRRDLDFPHPGTGAAPILLAHQLLAGADAGGAGAVCTVALRDGPERFIGAVTLERPAAFAAEERDALRDVAAFAGPVLERTRQAALPWWRRVFKTARTDGAARRPSRIGVALGIAAIVGICFIPVTWRVSAPARLEGSVQRAIVASTDGFLQQANVRAGDAVREGQVLAELASQDMELERRRRESELRQHENAYRAAQARNDRTQMVISQSRASEAQAMLSLVQGQLDRARIVAPFDGVVIKGDLSQTLGAPVQRGEVLLTLAPSESFRLIVEVDEADIAAIQVGQPGTLALAAQPDRTLRFLTRRIVPVANASDGRNYFEVEATLEPGAAALRPGLSGIAKVEAGSRRIGWILTHRIVDWLRLAWWSAGW